MLTGIWSSSTGNACSPRSAIRGPSEALLARIGLKDQAWCRLLYRVFPQRIVPNQEMTKVRIAWCIMQRAAPVVRTLARKVQAPAARAVVAGQRNFFGGGDDVPSDPKDLVCTSFSLIFQLDVSGNDRSLPTGYVFVIRSAVHGLSVVHAPIT